MYTKVWEKFLPVIRIFLKRAGTAPQTVKLDKIDFDKAGGGKKAGYSYTAELKKGKVTNRLTSAIALDMIKVLQTDEKAMDTLRAGEFEIELNSKCELSITNISEPSPEPSPEADTEMVNDAINQS